MVTFWNDIRLTNGQPTLGFMNPLLYTLAAAHPDAFYDVVVGDNKCLVHGSPCCSHGFYASPGWDAASGLGTPNFFAIANYILNPDANFLYTSGNKVVQTGKDFTALGITVLVIASLAFLLSIWNLYKNWSSNPFGKRSGMNQPLRDIDT